LPNGDDLTIHGVLTDRVGTPRNDGTRGSGLYAVPIRLSRSLAGDEARLLEHLWDRPPEFTTMHRPGIARVSGDVITLDGTTIDEVERYHARTLSLVVDAFNLQIVQLRLAEAEQQAREAADREAHRQHVEDVTDRLRFGLA
jgi:hypothetical protein